MNIHEFRVRIKTLHKSSLMDDVKYLHHLKQVLRITDAVIDLGFENRLNSLDEVELEQVARKARRRKKHIREFSYYMQCIYRLSDELL